jgi:hypothetical protein
MADGTQYVVVPLVVAVGTEDDREYRPRLYAFRVDGATPMPPSASVTTEQANRPSKYRNAPRRDR